MPDRQPTGFEVLLDPALNKSTAFTEEERDRYKLRGLLPPSVGNQAKQQSRVLENLRRKNNDIERYIFLTALQGRNERLFYRTVIDHIEELLPLIYTPTVGQACKEFAHIFRQPRGFYVTPQDRGRVRTILDNWPARDVRLIVVTDGERILGLGDLGANGMAIPIGKLALYVACAGLHPRHCMPVMLDVGTNNTALRNDPLYLGVSRPRLAGNAYLELLDEFVAAVQDAFPGALIQFEDFLTGNAYRLLDRYRRRALCFNDDIQGTAAVALAGVLAATRISGLALSDATVLFLGAGSAATGIADLMAAALVEAGLPADEARRRLWFVDPGGLVVAERPDLKPHNRRYAHDHPRLGFVEAIRALRPQVLIGATGAPGTFTGDAVRAMAAINERPVIFALSNPTSRAECTAQQAYDWSEGRAIFASGSPFDPLVVGDRTVRPGQANNVYVFPGIGLGALACGARWITDEMFLTAARVLAAEVGEDDLSAGSVYPELTDIREVSLKIATAVAGQAFDCGLATAERPQDLASAIAASRYDPTY